MKGNARIIIRISKLSAAARLPDWLIGMDWEGKDQDELVGFEQKLKEYADRVREICQSVLNLPSTGKTTGSVL